MECQNGVHVNTLLRASSWRRHRLHQHTREEDKDKDKEDTTRRGFLRSRSSRPRSFFSASCARSNTSARNESIVGENASVSLVDVERVHPDLGPAGRGILAEQNERRRGRERTNDGRDVGIDVLVDVFSHLGDFTVAPDLRGQVLDNNFSVMSRIFTWAVVEYISVSPSTSIFNRSVLLCRPCLRRGVLTTFLFILTASRAAATLRSRRGVPPR